ncbi:putative F-box protein [Cardamine amara subsp. amara]|uniref:F-box protein n=1 Tax=Cardamine amara subsp. amara TaxID=228776 RepID=A0ABD1ABG8_CARAN
MSDLPEECRTSLKTLRYTCKRWNRLCNQRRFIRKHSDKAPKQLLILMLKDSRVCSMSVNLHGVPSVKVTLEVNLLDPRSNFDHFNISNISHCEGLLLFTNKDHTKIVVWNPCTGQTRWIPPPIKRSNSYALGSYQYNKSGDIRYKILCYVPCFGSFNYKF